MVCEGRRRPGARKQLTIVQLSPAMERRTTSRKQSQGKTPQTCRAYPRSFEVDGRKWQFYTTSSSGQFVSIPPERGRPQFAEVDEGVSRQTRFDQGRQGFESGSPFLDQTGPDPWAHQRWTAAAGAGREEASISGQGVRGTIVVLSSLSRKSMRQPHTALKGRAGLGTVTSPICHYDVGPTVPGRLRASTLHLPRRRRLADKHEMMNGLARVDLFFFVAGDFRGAWPTGRINSDARCHFTRATPACRRRGRETDRSIAAYQPTAVSGV